MKQLGLLEGSNILGDDIEPEDDPYRTKVGDLKRTPRKAISWYEKEHSLKISLSTYPIINFLTTDKQIQGVPIEEIVSDYEQRDKRNRNA